MSNSRSNFSILDETLSFDYFKTGKVDYQRIAKEGNFYRIITMKYTDRKSKFLRSGNNGLCLDIKALTAYANKMFARFITGEENGEISLSIDPVTSSNFETLIDDIWSLIESKKIADIPNTLSSEHQSKSFWESSIVVNRHSDLGDDFKDVAHHARLTKSANKRDSMIAFAYAPSNFTCFMEAQSPNIMTLCINQFAFPSEKGWNGAAYKYPDGRFISNVAEHIAAAISDETGEKHAETMSKVLLSDLERQYGFTWECEFIRSDRY